MASSPQPQLCPQCGKDRAGALFECPHCGGDAPSSKSFRIGRNIVDEEHAAKEAEIHRSKQRSTFMAMAVLVSAIVLLTLGAALVGGRDGIVASLRITLSLGIIGAIYLAVSNRR